MDGTISEGHRRGRPHPDSASVAFYELEGKSRAELERAFLRGARPEIGSLAGWEFRGVNVPVWAHALGIKKFIKGFYREGADVLGYNRAVVQNRTRGPWLLKPGARAQAAFGFFRVTRVEATSRDNAYLHAALLDYGAGGNLRLDPSRGLRDYIVQVGAENPDLFLGKAYYAVGPLRVPVSFFVIERHARIES